MTAHRGQAMGQSAVRWSKVAGLAWFVGFAYSFVVQTTYSTAHSATFVALLATWAFGFLLYGVWALLIGLRLLQRPTPTILSISVAFAVLNVAQAACSPPGLETWIWFSYIPTGVAGLASLVALIVGRQRPL